ncbi:MAG: hypothetical protein ABR574_07475 [Cryomorphaceae bacterium]|nr:hypothetical protein [Flavobacteriales bacterium]
MKTQRAVGCCVENEVISCLAFRRGQPGQERVYHPVAKSLSDSMDRL